VFREEKGEWVPFAPALRSALLIGLDVRSTRNPPSALEKKCKLNNDETTFHFKICLVQVHGSGVGLAFCL
jgi:hypothetical protein